MKRTSEPFWWTLFGAGGTVSAFVVPGLLFLTGLAFPLGWIDAPSYEHISTLVHAPIARVILLAVIALSMFHWAHRFRFTLYDGLQIKHLNILVALFCYGTAAIVSLAAVVVLIRL